jgi:hypothetical protein
VDEGMNEGRSGGMWTYGQGNEMTKEGYGRMG